MKLVTTPLAIGVAAVAIGCGGPNHMASDRTSGVNLNAPVESVTRAQTAQLPRRALIGCLEAGNQPGTYMLRVTADAMSGEGGRGVTGLDAARSDVAPGGSTTGRDGDLIRNGPTIGSG